MRTTWEVYQGRDFDLRINVTGLSVSDYDSAKAQVRAYPGSTVLATLTVGSGITKQTSGSLNALDLLLDAGTTGDIPVGVHQLDVCMYNAADTDTVKPIASYFLTVKASITEVT